MHTHTPSVCVYVPVYVPVRVHIPIPVRIHLPIPLPVRIHLPIPVPERIHIPVHVHESYPYPSAYTYPCPYPAGYAFWSTVVGSTERTIFRFWFFTTNTNESWAKEGANPTNATCSRSCGMDGPIGCQCKCSHWSIHEMRLIHNRR